MSTQLVDVSVWIPELATRVAGAPNDTLRQELAATLREFYVASGSWVSQSLPMDTVAGQDTYRTLPFTQGDLLYIYAVLIDDVPVNFQGTQVPGTFRLKHAPNESKTKAMVVVAAIRPRDYSLVPSTTETYDFDTILDGATGRLFNMPDKPWSNEQSARYYLKRFRIGSGRARVRTQSAYTKNDEGFRFPSWT